MRLKVLSILLYAALALWSLVHTAKHPLIGLGITQGSSKKLKLCIPSSANPPNASAPNLLSAAAALPALPLPPVTSPIFDFLDQEPALVPYSLPDNEIAYRNRNTPPRGYCGWAGLSLGLYGNGRGAVNIRQTVLNFVQGMSEAQLVNLVYQYSPLRDPWNFALQPEEIDQLRRFETTLRALPGVLADGGFLADLTDIGAVLTSAALGRRIELYTTLPDSAEAVLRLEANPDAAGVPLRLHLVPGGAHWEGVVGGNDGLPHGLAVFVVGADDEQEEGHHSDVLDTPALAEADQEDGESDGEDTGETGEVDLEGKDVLQLESALQAYWKFDKDVSPPSAILTKLEDCPDTGRFWVRILRYSWCPPFDAADWLAIIAREKNLLLPWIQTFDPTATLQDIVVIIVQRRTLQNLQSLDDTYCEAALPVTSTPAHLRALRATNLIKGLILTSPDGLFSGMPTLQRFLHGIFGQPKEEPCIPIFRVLVYSHTDPAIRQELESFEVARGLAGLAVDEHTSSFLSGMRKGVLKRLLNGLSMATGSSYRNLAKPTKIKEHPLTPKEAAHIGQLPERILGITLQPLIAPASLANMPELSPSESPLSFRLHRWSRWKRHWPFRKDEVGADAFLAASLSKAREQLKIGGSHKKPLQKDSWQALAIGLPGLSKPDALSKLSYNYPPGAAGRLVSALKLGRVHTLSLPSADSLLVDPGALQRLLTGQVDGGSGYRMNFNLHISGYRSQSHLLRSWDVVRALGSPSDKIDDPLLRDFCQVLLEGRISRWAQILGARIGGAGYRNAQTRIYPFAPQNAYTIKYAPNGKRIFHCTAKKGCKKVNSDPFGRDRHYHTCAKTKLFGCKTCPKRFDDKSSFDRHEKIHLSSTKRHQCPECIITFSQLGNVRTHIKKEHKEAFAALVAKEDEAKASGLGSKSGRTTKKVMDKEKKAKADGVRQADADEQKKPKTKKPKKKKDESEDDTSSA